MLLWSGDDLALHGSLLEQLKAEGVPLLQQSYRQLFPKGFP